MEGSVMNRTTAMIELIILFVWGVLDWSIELVWFLLKVFVAVGIGWGILRSLTPFPMETISYWQDQLQSPSPNLPGVAYISWVADNWLSLAVLTVLVLTIRSHRILRVVGITNPHAAFAVSALANYLDVDPTTPRLLKIQGEEVVTLTRLSWTAFKDGLVGRIFWNLTGVPFLPEDAIPGRKGDVVSFKEDFRTYFSESVSETTRPYQ